jgi:hypothetical protein
MLLFLSFTYANPSDKNLDELLILSGITEQISQLPSMIKAGMTQAHKQSKVMPEKKYKELVNSVDTYILASEIILVLKNELQKSITDKEIQELLVWYKSDIGKKITKAEELASTPTAYKAMIQSKELLLKDSKRVVFSQKLDKLIGATQLAIELQLYTAVTTTSAMLSIIEPDVPLDIKRIHAQLFPRIMQSYDTIQELVILSFVYAYKDISIEDLNTYMLFLNQKNTIKMNTILLEAMNKGVQKSISKWAKNIAKIVIEE